ncbi:MAG: STAS domain-containing protein [Salinivirgaceae bacterium]|jgi:anti-sigma B factor antagonist|nr:STAS domain-containing protein [Salinivirgaceae bacterium]
MLVIDKNNPGYVVASFPQDKQRLNVVVSDEFKKQLYKLIDDGASVVIVDFTHVDFIDSSGFGAIVATFNHARNHQVTFKLCCIASSVMNLIKITKLDQVLQIYPSLDEAIQSVN